MLRKFKRPFKPADIPVAKLDLAGLPWVPEDVAMSLSAITLFLRKALGPEAIQIGLYGSWQRGDATPESDVDIAVFLAHEVRWFDAEKGVVNRLDAWKDRRRWRAIERKANRYRLDSREYSIVVVTPGMLHYCAARGPIHVQNWAYAVLNCYLLHYLRQNSAILPFNKAQ